MAEGNLAGVLAYDGTSGINERRGARIMGCFWLGIVTGAMVAAGLLFGELHGRFGTSNALKLALVMSGGLGLAHLLPMTFGMGLAVWIRQKKQGALHYRGPLAPVLWGLVGGFGATVLAWVPWLSLGFSIVLSSVAGMSVCAKPHEGEQESVMLYRSVRTYWMASGLLLAFLGCAGFLSAWVSREACERHTAQKVIVEELHGQSFTLSEHPSEGAERIFRAGGFIPQPAGTKGKGFLFPWADVGNAWIDFPFIVSVEYGFSDQGDSVKYICLFGYTIVYFTEMEWIA